MTRIHRTSVLVLFGGAALILAFGATADQETFHKPMAPIGPTSQQQCLALEGEWTKMCKRISDAHQQCLDAYEGSNVKGAGECSRGPCLSLHTQMTSCGGEERTRQVSACNASVREHQAREAEFRRAEEAAVRAAQDAERARLERLGAETARSSMEAELARQRADQYRRNLPSVPQRDTSLGERQARLVEDLRERAEAAADAARSIPNRVSEALNAVGERADRVTDSIQLDNAFTKVFDQVFPGVNNLREYIGNEATSAADDWGAVIDGESAFLGIAGKIPVLRFPMGTHVGRVTQGIKEANLLALNRLDSAITNFMNGTPFDDNFQTTHEDAMRELLKSVVPLELIERLDRMTYTFENGRNGFYRLFNP